MAGIGMAVMLCLRFFYQKQWLFCICYCQKIVFDIGTSLVGTGISTGSITVTTHDRKYQKGSLGVKTLLSIEKYKVDPLGEYHKVHIPEKRQTFR